ncbi:MAG: hypothetical protein LBD64_00750, partial [Odoribacteraceae bacterium]|nr:hypothetical protein [Odoribacteraceae bacterium]
YERWIGVINTSSGAWVYTNARIEDGTETLIGGVPYNVVSIEQSGKILLFVTARELYYSLLKGKSYSSPKAFPALPELHPLVSQKITPEYVNLKDYAGYESEAWTSDNNYFFTPGILERVAGVCSDRYPREALFYDAFLLRYAFRLHDGTLASFSPPQLVCPSIKMAQEKYSDESVYGSPVEGVFPVRVNVIQKDWDPDKTQWKWSVKGGSIGARPYEVSLVGDASALAEHEDVIKSIDVFISLPLGFLSSAGMATLVPVTFDHGPDDDDYDEAFIRVDYNNTILEDIKDVSTFYLADKFSGFKSSFVANLRGLDVAKAIRPAVLVQQEEMGEDVIGHNRIGADLSFSYNNRVHLAGIHYELFAGFTPSCYAIDNIQQTYNGIAALPNPYPSWTELYIETELEIDGERKRVMSAARKANGGSVFLSGLISFPDARAKHFSVIGKYIDGRWYKYYEGDLLEHPFLDLAYYACRDYVSGDMQTGHLPCPVMNTLREVIAEPPMDVVEEHRPNLVRVSMERSPMAYSNLQSYSIGSGRIIAMSSNVMSVSDRNYGTRPLFVFSTDGVWTLAVGDGSVLYSNISAPTSRWVAISPVTGQVPGGTLFITDRGIASINSAGAAELTMQLFDDAPGMILEPYPRVDNLVAAADCPSFREFAAGAKAIMYEPVNNEAFIVNPAYDFHHVIDMSSGQVYRSPGKATRFVQNVYPAVIGYHREVVGNDGEIEVSIPLEDFSREGNAFNDVTIITRPVSFSIPDRKKLGRVIARGLLDPAGGELVVGLYGSNDGAHFAFISGRSYITGTVDADLGMAARSNYRYYVIVIAGRAGKETFISFVDAMISKRELNNKMR